MTKKVLILLKHAQIGHLFNKYQKIDRNRPFLFKIVEKKMFFELKFHSEFFRAVSPFFQR